MSVIHSNSISNTLICTVCGRVMGAGENAYECPEHSEIRYPVDEDGIIRAFVPEEGEDPDVVIDKIKDFYEETPFPEYDEMETVGSLIEKSRDRVFPEMLNQTISPNAKVLEVGCGTGQLGNFLSIADRQIVSVDLCLNSLRMAQGFKVKSELENVTFAQMNLFRLPLKPESFDVVICTGVLHHTHAPEKAFFGLLPLLKPGGHIIIGLYNRYGRLKTRARGYILRPLGMKYAWIDPYLRKYDVTGKKLKSWFYDQYHNPHESLHTMDEVLKWFAKGGIRFMRSIPSAVFGSDYNLDYRRSLFESEPQGSRLDRLFSQIQQMVNDIEGGLFIMIGKKE